VTMCHVILRTAASGDGRHADQSRAMPAIASSREGTESFGRSRLVGLRHRDTTLPS
jgi:hypothetical protein